MQKSVEFWHRFELCAGSKGAETTFGWKSGKKAVDWRIDLHFEEAVAAIREFSKRDDERQQQLQIEGFLGAPRGWQRVYEQKQRYVG